MSRAEDCVRPFLEDGWNCAQAIFATYAPELGIDEASALRLAAPFGGGLSRHGDACGAVVGAMMVLGQRYATSETTPEAKAQLYAIVDRLFQGFRQEHGSIQCRDLLGCDISTPEGAQESKERNTHSTICAGLVRSAALILESVCAAVEAEQ